MAYKEIFKSIGKGSSKLLIFSIIITKYIDNYYKTL
jgi:hypothetical protein